MPETFDALNTTRNVRIQLRCTPGLYQHLQAEAEKLPVELRGDWQWKVKSTTAFLRAREQKEAARQSMGDTDAYGTSLSAPSISRTPLVPDWADSEHAAGEAKPARLFILDLLLPADIAPDVHQNLCDLYPMWLAAHGKKRADIIYNAQVARIIFGCFCNWSLRSVERVLQSIRLIGPS